MLRVGKERGEIRLQGHTRRVVHSFTGASLAGPNFALHFRPQAITLSKF
jgi:hypothetical protein